MYNQIIYFIVALLLFSLQEPGAQALPPAPSRLLYAVAVFFLYSLCCRVTFRGILRDGPEMSRSLFTQRYYRAQTRLSILALACLAVYVYALDIKVFFRFIPGFEKSLLLPGLAALGIFMAHLLTMWYWSHPVYREVHYSEIGRARFLKGNLGFNTAILIPWFIISLCSDLLQFVRVPSFLGREAGETVLMVVIVALFLLFAPWLVVRLWGCTSIPPGFVRFELRKFCEEHRFKVGDFLLWPLFGGEMLTAGVIGILPRFRYILVTSGLLRILDPEELRAVVAHEMGHVRRLHLPAFFLFFGLFSALIYSFGDLGNLFVLLLLKNHSLLDWALSPGGSGETFLSLATIIPSVAMLVLFFRYIFGYFLRNSERQADLFAMRLMGTPAPLITSFQKIASHSGRIEDLPSWHHYSIRERIDFLARANDEPGLVRKHDRKLYGSALAFVLLSLVLIWAGASAGKTRIVKQFQEDVQLGLFEHELSKGQASAEIRGAYGGLLFEKGQYAEAESALKSALEAAPEDPAILNNLAWLYATAPSPQKNPDLALELAKKAAGISSKPYILDTLAEAYFVNGMLPEAIEAIDRAIEGETGDKSHYLEQKQKFEQALRNFRST